MKTKNNKFFMHYLPTAFSLFMLVTVQRVITTDGGYDKLFGFPFPYISNNYGYSFHYDVYVGALIIDVVVYLIIVMLLFKIGNRFGLQLKSNIFLMILGISISVYWILTFCFITRDSTFKAVNDVKFNKLSDSISVGIHP